MTDKERELDEATAIAAQVWCDDRCADIEMDTRLAEVFAERLREKTQRIAELEKEIEAAEKRGFEAGAHWRSNAGTHGKIPGVICISERTIEDGWQKYSRLKSLKG